jgi:protein TonB
MRSRRRLFYGALLLTGGALPVWAQEAPSQGSGEKTPDNAAQTIGGSAEGGNQALSARIPTGYPARALREEREGTVALMVTVTPEGRATDCIVTQSSGHTDLDHAACKEITEKARFAPALDDDGKPVAAQFSTMITFRIK